MGTESFPIGRHLRHGWILSPFLFYLYSEWTHGHRQTDTHTPTGLDSEEGGVKMGGRNITNVKYADDTISLAESGNDSK